MKHSLLTIIGLILLLSLFGLYSGFAEGAQETPASDKVESISPISLTVAGLKGPSSIGMMPLFAAPPDLGEGISVDYTIVADPQLMVSRILAGELDIAAVPINLAGVLYNKGLPFVLGAVPGDGILHIVSSRKDVQNINDLRGKKIYCIAQGSTPEFVLRYTLMAAGLDPETDLEIDFSFDHVSIAPQLIAGKVDLAVLPEPFVSIVAAKNPAVRPVIDLQKVWAENAGSGEVYPITGILVREELYQTHPEAMERFFAAYAEAVAWVNTNPEKTGKLAEEFMQMPAAVVAAAMPNLNLRFQTAREARSRVDEFFSVLYRFAPSSIGGKLPGDDFYAP